MGSNRVAEHFAAVGGEPDRGVGTVQVLISHQAGDRGAGCRLEDLPSDRTQRDQTEQQRQGGQPQRDRDPSGPLGRVHSPP
jgi:hypothetical protein